MSLLSISSYVTWKGNDETPCKGEAHAGAEENSPVFTAIEKQESRVPAPAGGPVEEFFPERTAPPKPARRPKLKF